MEFFDLATLPSRSSGRSKMKLRITLLALAFAIAIAVPALANQCPPDIKKIDAAMANANPGQEQMGEVKRLRDEGQRLHEQGDHQQSMDTLARAKQMLGVM
jgi:hypothetical protein